MSTEPAPAPTCMVRSPDRHEWLGFPDGGLADVEAGALVEKVWEVLAGESPDVVATFGPDGITGHPDHIAVGRATTAALMRADERGGHDSRRLLHAAIPQSQLDRCNAGRTREGLFRWDGTMTYHLRGAPITPWESRWTPGRWHHGRWPRCGPIVRSGRHRSWT